jgi:hypothetical protein
VGVGPAECAVATRWQTDISYAAKRAGGDNIAPRIPRGRDAGTCAPQAALLP